MAMISMMSYDESERKLSEAPEHRDTDSVFDFLYVDQRRIASFLSQFNNFGDLTQIVSSRSARRSKADESALSGSGGVVVAKGEARSTSTQSAHHDAEN